MVKKYLEFVDKICFSYMSLQQLYSPEAFEGRGSVIPESQVTIALCSQSEIEKTEALFDEFKDLCAESGENEFPLFRVFFDYDLSYFDKLVVLLAFAFETNRKYERIFGFLQDNVSEPYPTLGLAVNLYEMMDTLDNNELVSLFSENHPVNKYFLTFDLEHKSTFGVTSGLSRRLKFSQGAYFALYNTGYLPATMSEVCSLVTQTEALYSVLDRSVYQPASTFISPAFTCYSGLKLKSQGFPVLSLLTLCGEKGVGKHFTLQYISEDLKINVVTIDFSALLSMSEETFKTTLRDILAYCFLSKSLPAISITTSFLSNKEDCYKKLNRVIKEFNNNLPALVILSETLISIDYKAGINHFHMDVMLPEMSIQREFWDFFASSQSMTFSKELSPESLASTYHFSPGQIKEVLCTANANALSMNSQSISLSDMAEAVKTMCRPKLSEITTYVQSYFSWEDLMLSPEAMEGLKQICDRVHHRFTVKQTWGFEKKQPYGKGISALFHGPPGTGKTMAVQVIAKELNLDIYKVDLSKIVDKYIGETEKKICELFDTAKHANAILFFDEADALFAKRTEVTDSKDKYANMETAYLLQRMEDYSGICIMATNISQNFDAAFKRRISFTVNITVPDVATRKLLWEKVFPSEAPVSQRVNFELLAEKFQLTGSNIKNVAVGAAYFAAASNETIDREHLAKSLKLELSKLGHMTNESEVLREI